MSADKDPGTAAALSVVMPSMNQAMFLAEAVRSVLGQDGPPTELVVMDGGSDDGSQALLATLANEHPGRLRWASGPDGGPAEAVNEAVRKTRAPLVGWLNSDDLYTPGSIGRAIAHLVGHPDHVMVYGHGEHVDDRGVFIESYPSRPPNAPLSDWVDGCHICQPTAFFKRETFLGLGGLDNSLKASFDYDLWLRMFKAYPRGIGFVEAVQAQTRLHSATITTRFRERVAFEGMQVIRKHLGPAPAHWLLTHFNELCGQHPFLPGALGLRERCDALIARAMPLVDSEGHRVLIRHLDTDVRLRLATPEVHIGVHADGWASSMLDVRIQQSMRPVRRVGLTCRQRSPGGGGKLSVRIDGPEGQLDALYIDGNGVFELSLPISDSRPGSRSIYRISTSGGFVPALCEPGSSDRRELAFLVEASHVEH